MAMNVLTAPSGFVGKSVGVVPGDVPAGPPGDARTYQQRIDDTTPDWDLPLNDASGTTAVAATGVNGAYVGTPELAIDPLTTSDAGAKSVGLMSGSYITAVDPLTGSADVTIDFAVQLDTLAPAQQIFVSIADGTAGGLGIEVQTAGQGQARAFRYPTTGGAVIINGSAGNFQQGTVHKVTLRSQTGASPSLEMLVDGVVVASDDNTRTYPAIPAATAYIGVYRTGSSGPMDGLISRVCGWERRLTDQEILDLVLVTDSVAWAAAINAGTIDVSTVGTAFSVKQGEWHGKEPVVASADDGSLVTTTESTDEITITSGVTEGADSFAFRFTDANSNVATDATCSVEVAADTPAGNDQDALVKAAPGQISDADLVAADLYYWSADIDDTIKDDWNTKVAVDRGNYATSHAVVSTNLNSKTKIETGTFNHDAVICGATDPVPDEVVSAPALSHYGTLRCTIRNKSSWNFSATDIRNFRKHKAKIRLRNPTAGYTINSSWDNLDFDQIYEGGFTFWKRGTGNFYLGKACAMFQVHDEQTAIYLQVNSVGQFSGHTRPAPASPTVGLPTFALTAGFDDIHVIRVRYRLGSSGFFTVTYNGVEQYTVNRTINPGTVPFFDLLMTYRDPRAIDSDNGISPSVAGSSAEECSLGADRLWHKAL